MALGPYLAVQRAQCLGAVGDWPGSLQAAQNALAIEGGGPRLTRIEALERAAEAHIKMGRRQEALTFYNRALELACQAKQGFTANGPAEMVAEGQLTTDQVHDSLGQAAACIGLDDGEAHRAIASALRQPLGRTA